MNKKLKEKLKKYKWKYRILLIYADNSKNKLVKQTIKKYEKYEKKFHDRNIKIIKSYDKDNDFKIVLIGYDGKKKGKFNKLTLTKIFKLVDDMPMSKKNNL